MNSENKSDFKKRFNNCVISGAAGMTAGVAWSFTFAPKVQPGNFFNGALAVAARNMRAGKLANAHIKSAHAEHENHSGDEKHHASSALSNAATNTALTLTAAGGETMFTGRLKQIETLKALNRYTPAKAWTSNLNFLVQRPTLLIFGQKSIVTLGFFGFFGLTKSRKETYQKCGFHPNIAQFIATIEAAGMTSLATHIIETPAVDAYKKVLKQSVYDDYHHLIKCPSVSNVLAKEIKHSFKAGLFGTMRGLTPAAVGGRAVVFAITAIASNHLNEEGTHDNHRGPTN